jgi:hypothetical protein
MKKTISVFSCLVFLMLATNQVQAQDVNTYFHIGYNASFPTGLDSLNYVIDRYNETRSYLDVQMEQITYLDGMTLNWGVYAGPVLFGFGYTGGGQKRYGQGVDATSNLMRRDLKVKSRMFDMDLGVRMINSSVGHLTLGSTFIFSSFVVKTRVAEESQIKKTDWTKINDGDTFMFGISIFLRWAGKNGFFLQPYYTFTPGDIFTQDMTVVNSAINSYTFAADPSPLTINHGMIGIKTGISITR